MFMSLNSLAAVQTKPTIKTAKQITQFFNYSVAHPDAVTEYKRSGMIIQIYLDASYISEPEARSRSGGIFSWDQNPTHRYNQCLRKMNQCM